MANCAHCKAPTPDSCNYCSWSCQVAEAIAGGGKVYDPNGLPISAITCHGDLLEHEHADHPTYIRPVKVAYIGPVGPDERHDAQLRGVSPEDSDDDVRMVLGETHALIYTDGHIAVTLYEACYAMFRVPSGACVGGWYADATTYKLEWE